MGLRKAQQQLHDKQLELERYFRLLAQAEEKVQQQECALDNQKKLIAELQHGSPSLLQTTWRYLDARASESGDSRQSV